MREYHVEVPELRRMTVGGRPRYYFAICHFVFRDREEALVLYNTALRLFDNVGRERRIRFHERKAL